MKYFLSEEAKIKLRADFRATDILECFEDYPLLKDTFQNVLKRKHSLSKHDGNFKTFVIRSALKHSQRSALDWSSALGGPLKSTIKYSCSPKIKILPFLDVDNLKEHLNEFKRIIVEQLEISDISKVPVQASLDATAVTGSMATRSSGDENGRLLYGLSTYRPFQQVRIHLSSSNTDQQIEFKETEECIIIDSLQSCNDLLESECISRGTSYVAILLLPLVEKPKPYCVGIYCISKGSDAETLHLVHRQLRECGNEVGVRIITNPGDGDSTLRSLQLTKFKSKRDHNWLTELTIPLQYLYSTDDKNPTFPMQDMLHNIKKGRNMIKMLDTKCLALGLDLHKEKEFMIRWDYVFELIKIRPDLLVHCSLSAVLLSDKQDPSLASELSCLYKHFFKEGYSAMGMYLKCIHYLMDAYLNKYLSPEERVFKVWYCKTFFMTWNKGKKHASQFITDETFKDINCCCDGLILYLLLLKKEFPSSAIVTYYLGSDPNEQAYAFCRISQFAGRRTNLSAMTLACGLEKLNIRSAQPGDEPFQIAHTRGKHVMKKAVPLDHEIIPDDPEVVPVWFGNSLNEQTIRNTMKNATKACIDDCKELGFPFFMKATPDQIPLTNAIGFSEKEIDVGIDEDNYVGDFDDDYDNDGQSYDDEDANPEFVSTSMGRLHLKTAEAIYLNGGKSTFTSKSRKSRFYKNCYSEKSDLKAYNTQSFCCSGQGIVKVGSKQRLPRFSNQTIHVIGQVRYLAKNFNPFKYYCPEHS